MDKNIYDIDFEKFEKIDILFYDGPHEYNNALKNYYEIFKCLKDKFIIIVDDYNDAEQRKATDEFMNNGQIQIKESSNLPYYRGLFVAECEKI